jgi:hypothetical protein
MKSKKELPIRLALRQEGLMWNAYAAKTGTMVDAVFLGCIPIRFVQGNEQRKRAFIDLMSGAFAEMVEEMVGQKPDMIEREAPEHEKSGNA